MKIKIPYYKSYLETEIEDKYVNGVFAPKLPPPQDQYSCVAEALDNPIASPHLEKLAIGKNNIVIITSDHTRPVPSKIIMPQLLARIRKGNPNANITILVATGFHRQTSREELVAKMGEDIVANERIVIHDSRDDASLVHAGTLPSGGELIINKLAMEADLLLAEGFIEPHFFAGFSGGRKSILPGIVSRKTVFANHCAEFIASPYARTGNLKDNPIHQDMLFAAKTAKLAFIVNVVLDAEKRIIHAVAGHYQKAHEEGCAWLGKFSRISVPESDIVITSNGGYPLDQNIYQSVKGMTAAETVCRKGGVIIIAASCADGHGGKSFFQNLSSGESPEELTKRILAVPRDKTEPDQWEFQIMARILQKCQVILVSTHCPHDIINAIHITPASSLQEALTIARQQLGQNAKISIIPDGVSSIPQVIRQ